MKGATFRSPYSIFWIGFSGTLKSLIFIKLADLQGGDAMNNQMRIRFSSLFKSEEWFPRLGEITAETSTSAHPLFCLLLSQILDLHAVGIRLPALGIEFLKSGAKQFL